MKEWFKRNQKIPKKIDDITDWILKILFVLIILIGIYVLYDKFYVYSLSGRESLQYSSYAEREDAIRQDYQDAIGWLYIPDTIDEPLMQAEDNVFYLNHGPDNLYSLRGSVYLDSRNNSDYSDPYMLCYGHHMSHYQMFGALDHYFDDAYWTEEHCHGVILQKDQSEIPFTVFAIGSIDTSIHEIFNPTEVTREKIDKFLSENKDIQTKIDIETIQEKSILCLSTCQTPDSTLRTCLFVYLNNDK